MLKHCLLPPLMWKIKLALPNSIGTSEGVDSALDQVPPPVDTQQVCRLQFCCVKN